jgi:Flp pilus assembly protein TadG
MRRRCTQFRAGSWGSAARMSSQDVCSVDVQPPREFRDRSQQRPRGSRGRASWRPETGQAAVEFALVVPLLCLVIVAILHFGKVMNYWLDLNHVASEGARKAAVNTYATDGEYTTWVRSRLETGELRSGGTTSIPTAATVAVCLPEGGEVGDPVTVRVAVGYSLPFIGTSVTLRGTATMRLEQRASFAGGGACT